MSNFIVPQLLPMIEPRSEYINEFSKMGIDAWYDLKRDQGNKIFNLMGRSKDFTNLIQSPEMNTDTDGNGVVNNFASISDGGITATYTLDDSAQRINITASTSVLRAYVFQSVKCSVGEIISTQCTYKISGNVTLQFWIEWYNSSNAYISSSYFVTGTSATYVVAENLEVVAPANTATARMKLGIKPNAIGDTGSAWFKNAHLVKAATLNHTGNTDAIVSGATPHPLGKMHDGIDDFGQVNDDAILNPTSAFSLGCFIKPITQQTGKGIIGKGTTGVNAYSYMLYLTGNSGTIEFYTNHSGGSQKATYASGIAGLYDGKPVFCVGTYDRYAPDGNRLKLYINSKLAAVATGSDSDIFNGSYPFLIGKPFNNIYYKGLIGDVIYSNDRALTAPQIKQVGNMLAWQYPGLALA